MVKDPDEQLGEAVHGAGAGAGRPRVRELLSHGIGAPRPPGAPVSPHPSPRGALSLGRSGRLLTWAQSVINSLFSPSPFSGNKGALRVPSFQRLGFPGDQPVSKEPTQGPRIRTEDAPVTQEITRVSGALGLGLGAETRTCCLLCHSS